MEKLVLRSDVVTLKATTEKLQRDLGIDVHEAADIVLAVLREHGSSIQFWTVPSRGLPYKDDEPSQLNYSSEWLESRWWDREHQQRQDELRALSGVRSYQDDHKIEDMALLRSDAYRLFLSDLLDRVAGKYTALPKSRLIAITELLSSISNLSAGRVKLSEVTKAFSDRYDGDKMMIYRRWDEFLCEPINEGIYSGYNKRLDIACEFTNSFNSLNSEHDQYLILKEDAVLLGQQLWMAFFNEHLNDAANALGIEDSVREVELEIKATTDAVVESTLQTEPDPLDLPPELDAANMAYRAVLNGHGGKSDTFKNRLIDYLQKNYSDLKPEAAQRIATVANPDKSVGRKKRDKE